MIAPATAVTLALVLSRCSAATRGEVVPEQWENSVYHYKYSHQHHNAQIQQGDKGEDRVDLQPMVDFFLEFEEDPTGVVASLVAELWDFLPPLANVEVRKNFNKLKSGFDAMHFMSRDTVVWLGASLLWVGLHLLLWDGRVNTLEDLEASLRSPGVRVQLPSHAALASGDLAPDTETTASKPATFLTSPQLDRLWNTWTSPDSSTRRLYTNVLYGLASHLLWILPTFIGKIPEPDSRRDSTALPGLGQLSGDLEPADDRLITLKDNLATAPLEKNWNRLMSLQGVFANIGINILNYLGKWIFWSLATRNII